MERDLLEKSLLTENGNIAPKQRDRLKDTTLNTIIEQLGLTDVILEEVKDVRGVGVIHRFKDINTGEPVYITVTVGVSKKYPTKKAKGKIDKVVADQKETLDLF